MRRSLPAALLLALVAPAALAGCSDGGQGATPTPAHSTGSPTAAPSKYAQYVALGDSYTAAPLVPPTDTSTICLRSKVNYPALVAQQLPGTRLTDVSCSGATSANMVTSQQGRTGSVPPQFDALGPGTDLVTVGIGGNDEGLFGGVLGQCVNVAGSDPAGSPCADQLGGRLTPILRHIRDHLDRVVQGIRQRSPKARVLVVGYPQIIPASGTCPDLPLATGDYPFARKVNAGLNRAVQGGAADAKAVYVDLWGPTEGHDICGRDPWINGRVTSADRALAYHPLAVEQQHVAELILADLGRTD